MATTRHCDRCGKSLTWTDGSAWLAEKQYRVEIEIHRVDKERLYDLCSDCTDALQAWIEKGKENEAD